MLSRVEPTLGLRRGESIKINPALGPVLRIAPGWVSTVAEPPLARLLTAPAAHPWGSPALL